MHTWTVPGYTDVRELGRNGRGRTLLATHAASGVPVTIRYLADDWRRDAHRLAEYRAGARVLASIESPFVAQVYEYVESDDGVATVREYVDGGSVRQLVAASGLHPEAALSVLKAGLLGLGAAHAAGATHGGYKPENLLVARDGSTKLADFTEVPSADSTDDISAALTTFLECLLGSRAGGGRAGRRALDRVPKQLRPLVSAAVQGDGTAVTADLDVSATTTYGHDWQSSARTRLAQQASRLGRHR